MSGLADKIMLQRIGEAMVVLNAETGQYYELNESGADMLEAWLRHDGATTPIVAELARRYDAPADELASDLSALLAELSAAGIIHPAADAKR